LSFLGVWSLDQAQLWFSEIQTENLKITLKVRDVLHHEETPYQDLMILDTFEFGRALILDGIIQTTERDEFIYHEAIVHIPMFTHPAPRRVLVVGGGDGGALREVLRHPSVEEAVQVEIDDRVIEACRRFLPGLAGSFDHPKARVVIGDGIRFVDEAREEYDVIIIDSTEPVGPAVGLFTAEFYQAVARALRPDGLFVAQTESPFVSRKKISRVNRMVRGCFSQAHFYLADVPTYPGGLWGFTMGSHRHSPLEVPPERFTSMEGLRYYSPDMHRRAFILPPFVQTMLEQAD